MFQRLFTGMISVRTLSLLALRLTAIWIGSPAPLASEPGRRPLVETVTRRVEAKAAVVTEHIDRREHARGCGGAPHPHEHDVGDLELIPGDVARPDLAQDLTAVRLRISPERPRQKAHPMAQPTWLEIHSVPSRARRRDEDRLDHLAPELLEAVFSRRRAHAAGPADVVNPSDLPACQLLGQVGHLVTAGAAPVHHAAICVREIAAELLGHPLLKLGVRQPASSRCAVLIRSPRRWDHRPACAPLPSIEAVARRAVLRAE